MLGVHGTLGIVIRSKPALMGREYYAIFFLRVCHPVCLKGHHLGAIGSGIRKMAEHGE